MENSVMLTWIIPVYNGEKYLAQAIDSILRQPCGDFEILVIDDGSTDNSLKIAQSYEDPRVKAIHKENGGVSSARNLGIENAKSKYIAFLDSDDVVCRGVYDEEIHGILLEGKIDLLSFLYYNGDQNLKYGNRRSFQVGEIECDVVRLDPFKHCSSFIYRYRLFEGDNGIRFPNGIKIREDVTFQFLAYRRAETMMGIERCWFVYRNNITSVLHGQKSPDFLIKHVIPAWYWCKSKCNDEKSQKQCDVWLFSEAVEYICLGCRAGEPIGKIKEAIELEPVQEAMSDYAVLWNGRKAIYEDFLENPYKFWLKQRVKGIIDCLARFLVRLPMLRTMYMKLKYKESLEALV